ISLTLYKIVCLKLRDKIKLHLHAIPEMFYLSFSLSLSVLRINVSIWAIFLVPFYLSISLAKIPLKWQPCSLFKTH
ncbi:hypothetical protein L9F63_004657, partial [Diploptera punctata]